MLHCPAPLPEAEAEAHIESLVEALRGKRVAVLTGAGCSTESGIPDYRGPETRRRARSPIRFSEFERDQSARQRYWARALVGYQRFADKQPNAAHHALADMEAGGLLSGLITQNVDDLHERAGHQQVVPLHGSLSQVRCMACGLLMQRIHLQQQLRALNPGWEQVPGAMAPDGDADIADAAIARFNVVDCPRCQGALKPWVVFFGENVPPERVSAAYGICDAADALLVVGSSLMVFSGYRFVRRAAAQQKPVLILNVGESRGDALATLRVEGPAGQLLPGVAAALGAPSAIRQRG